MVHLNAWLVGRAVWTVILEMMPGYFVHEEEVMDSKKNVTTQTITRTEVLSGTLSLKTIYGDRFSAVDLPSDKAIEARLQEVNTELEAYTNNADKLDYAFAIASGILAGIIDSVFVGTTSFSWQSLSVSHKQVNRYIEKFAKEKGLKWDKEKRLEGVIKALEKEFKVAQDNTWKGVYNSIGTRNHHLADIAHHPTPLGLVSSIVVQLLRIATFFDRDGEIHFQFVGLKEEERSEYIQTVVIPAVLTGILNWLVYIGSTEIKKNDSELPDYIIKLAHIIASTPILIEIVNCANNWYGHLVSDMGGSKSTSGGGMGIPGVFLSLFYELSMLPILNKTKLPAYINDLYTKKRINLRNEIPFYNILKNLGKQAIPVLFNEVLVRISYFIYHLHKEYSLCGSLETIDWEQVIPFGNRTIDRMIAISSMTFTVADTVDAAVRSAVESGANWTLFAGRFVTRFNYVGAGRAAVAVAKEISNEKKEEQLLREKRLLTEAKTANAIAILEEYKAALEERVSNYLAEDIQAFMEGFDYMDQGFATNDSNLIIKGNVVIQSVLGREPQFTTQDEFDDLMDSDIPLKL